MALERYIKRYMSISAVVDMLCRRELALLDPQTWDDRNDRYFMGLYKEFAQASGLYAACFTQSPETYHHWRVFTGTSDGACVEFDRAAFEKYVQGNCDIRPGEVKYLLLKEAESLTSAQRADLPFLKRSGFEPEEEYRVIATSSDQQSSALSLPIDLALILRIYINPWLPDSIHKSVKSVLQNIDGCSHIRIIRSQLINSQRWKNAGNQVAGKPKMGRLVLDVGTSLPTTPRESKKANLEKAPARKKKSLHGR